MEARATHVRVGLLLAAIVLVAFNLRGSVVGVGPLLKDIAAATGLPASALGLLVTLPLIGFGLISPVAPWLARRFGIERVLIGSMVILTFSTLFRSAPDAWTPFLPAHTSLLLGTALIGCCIGAGNVLVPSLIRRDLPTRVGPVTSLFVASFSGIGAVAAAVAVPLEQLIGWRWALAAWAVPAAAAALLWLPLARRSARAKAVNAEAGAAATPSATAADDLGVLRKGGGTLNVWRSPLAWAVTAFMGLQSLCFYVLVAWLPSLLRDTGLSAARAGLLASMFQTSCLVGGFVAPTLVARVKDQRAYSVGASLIILVGFGMLMVSPSWPLAGIVTGFGCGASLGVAVVMFSARSANSADTAALSGMAQSIGYLVSAAGPVLFGVLKDASSSWNVPLAVVGAIAVVQAGVALIAGKPGVMRPSP